LGILYTLLHPKLKVFVLFKRRYNVARGAVRRRACSRIPPLFTPKPVTQICVYNEQYIPMVHINKHLTITSRRRRVAGGTLTSNSDTAGMGLTVRIGLPMCNSTVRNSLQLTLFRSP